MSLFDNLFGRKQPEKQKPAPPPAKPIEQAATTGAIANPAEDPNLIKVFDAYGREVFITRDQWRTNVLPGTLKANWNNPDQLSGIVIQSLNDGFFPDVLSAAEQLHRIDPLPSRAACVYGIVLMKNNRLDDAENVFRDYLAKHGEDGSVLTNLAKVYSARNEPQKSLDTLWRGLQVDPNQDNGMGWYEVIHREKGGPDAGLEALRRVAAIPGSWRAQLWLARSALQNRRLDEALALYKECLARVPKPPPDDLLMQMSGDLGNAGHIPEILQLVEPHFDVHAHGLPVGNNLIKAHIDLGQLDAARRVLDQLYSLNRMDWKQNLSFWDTEISKAALAVSAPIKQSELKVAILTIEGPIWLKPSSPAAELFPAKVAELPSVAFLGGTAEMATNSQRVERQMADAAGRMSRALPLFLAEHTDFHSRARVQTLVPWIVNGGGFILSGVAWKDEDAVNHSRQGQIKSDYVVVTHLKTQSEPWTVDLRLVRTIDGKCLGTLSTSFASTRPQETLPGLAPQLLKLLTEHAEIESQPAPLLYQVPQADQFPFYLLRLEQLLAVRCAGMDGVQSGFLHGGRDIIDGNIHLCVDHPENVSVRILLAQTLLAMKRAQPNVLPEFKEKIELLQREKLLNQPAQGIVQRLVHDAFSA
jgi:tetratricopeptide (TPR) repeat protein